jgi:hypothetical protein
MRLGGALSPENTTMSKYKWVWHGSEKLFQVGILSDDTLWNPNRYPDEIVRATVLAADARRHERRSAAAKKAARTRHMRQTNKVYVTARRIVAGVQTGPRDHCCVCGRGLGDPESVARGIGSECWQGVLGTIESIHAPETVEEAVP